MTIDGQKIAEEINMGTIELLNGARLGLAAVLVGGDVNARRFLELKKLAAEKFGVSFRLYEFPETITTQNLRKEIVAVAKTKANDGVIIELPLPARINTQYVLNAVPIEKDPDVLSERSQGAFFCGRSPVMPPSVEAVRAIANKYGVGIRGKNCAVFGYGILVGKPVAHWLASEGATVSVINEFTKNPADYSHRADIIISGVGKRDLITTGMVKEGAVVIDFARDVDFENVSRKTSLITPPIGGVGPIVIAAVLKNLAVLRRLVYN